METDPLIVEVAVILPPPDSDTGDAIAQAIERAGAADARAALGWPVRQRCARSSLLAESMVTVLRRDARAGDHSRCGALGRG
jgi:hypothetical protein